MISILLCAILYTSQKEIPAFKVFVFTSVRVAQLSPSQINNNARVLDDGASITVVTSPRLTTQVVGALSVVTSTLPNFILRVGSSVYGEKWERFTQLFGKRLGLFLRTYGHTMVDDDDDGDDSSSGHSWFIGLYGCIV